MPYTSIWSAAALLSAAMIAACAPERPALRASVEAASWARPRPAAIDPIPRPVREPDARGVPDGGSEEGEPELIPNWRPQPPSGERGGALFGFEAVPGTGWVPPDAGLAVGMGHIVAIVNGQVAFFDKAGTALYRRPIAGAMGFWVERGAGGLVFDPEAHYDPYHDRFWLAACEQTGSAAFFELAVSASGDPTQGWHKYRFDVTALAGGADIDSANLAVGPGAVFLSADFEAGGERTLVLILPTAELLGGQMPGPSRSMVMAGCKGAALAVRADTSGAAQYLVESSRGTGGSTQLALHAIQNGLVDPRRFDAALVVPAYELPASPTQPGTAVTLNLYDARVWSAVCRNGSLWATHAVGLPGAGRTVVRWYEVALNGWPGAGTPTLRQWGEVDAGPGLHCFSPSIAVDSRGNATLTYSRSGASEFPGMWTSRRRWFDPSGTLRTPSLVKASTASFTIYDRWGDYTATVTDPASPCAFWGHGEWTTSSADWRTWIARYDNYADADADRDCVLSVQDFTAFLQLYAAGDPRADADRDGRLTALDFTAFLQSYAAGR